MKFRAVLILFVYFALSVCLSHGQATVGFHRVSQVIARAPLGSVNAQVVPYATIVLTSTATGGAAAVYSDPGLSVGIPNSTLTADSEGNYDYYFALSTCVTETIATPNGGITTIPNVCSNIGDGTTHQPISFDNSNAGDPSGTSFNGSVSRNISANTLGAASLLTSTPQTFAANIYAPNLLALLNGVDVSAFGAVGDGQGNASASYSGTTVTCATCNFVPGDAGKIVSVNNGTFLGTIATYISATQITTSSGLSGSGSGVTISWGTDNTAAFNSALQAGNNRTGNQYLGSYSYPAVHVPSGTYMLSGTIYVHGGGVLYGDGGSSTLWCLASAVCVKAGYLSNGSVDPNPSGFFTIVNNLNFEGWTNSTAGLQITGAGFTVFKSFFNTPVGILVSSGVNGLIFDNNFGNNSTGIELEGAASSTIANNAYFGTKQYDVDIQDAYDILMSNENHQEYIGNAIGSSTGGPSYIQIADSTFHSTAQTNASSAAINLGNTTGVGASNIQIVGANKIVQAPYSAIVIRGANTSNFMIDGLSVSYAGTASTSGFALSYPAILVSSNSTAPITIRNSSFDHVGSYAVLANAPVDMSNNTCSNAFTQTGVNSSEDVAGCFAYSGPMVSISKASNNRAVSTTYPAVSSSQSNTTELETFGNISGWTYDVSSAGNISSGNERTHLLSSPTTNLVNFPTGINVASCTGCGVPVPTVADTSTPVTVSTTNPAEYHFNENATAGTAITYNLPTAAAGKQFCFSNAYNGSAANTGTLELLTSATGQFIVFTDGTLSATNGYVISGGAAADAACVVGIDTTHWALYVQRGVWTKH